MFGDGEQVAKDALQHSMKDVASLRDEIAQLKASSAGRSKETANDTIKDQSQLSRLQNEVEQVTIAAEINKAKADLYDEVAKHAQALEEEVKKLSSSDMERAVLEQELGRVSDVLKVGCNAFMQHLSACKCMHRSFKSAFIGAWIGI